MPHLIGPRNQPASSLNEGQARYILIDPALRAAGWNLEDRTQIGFEIPVDGYDAAPWNGVTDYCLYAPGGEVIAVVEAKRCSRNPREADEQLRHYVAEIAKGHVLTLDAIPDYHQVVQRAFEQHVAAHRYNADQIRFLRAVQELFLKQRHLVEADLYEPPLTVFGRNAVDRYFSPAEIRGLLELTERLAV